MQKERSEKKMNIAEWKYAVGPEKKKEQEKERSNVEKRENDRGHREVNWAMERLN